MTKDLDATSYQTIQDFLIRNCGILLGENKQYLVISRLSPLLNIYGLSTFAELCKALNSVSSAHAKLKHAVIDAMTTNETFWFRDERQFSLLKKTILPELFAQKTGTIKIWSAACSSGQEPYSIGMTALDSMRDTGARKTLHILGTDISETILDEAKKAEYSELALSRGLDPINKARYFRQNFNGYSLDSEVSRLVRFQQFNLLKPFDALGRFDMIFCRNVLIYFPDDIKRDILSRMANCLEIGGYLFLSSTESMPSDLKIFQPVHAAETSFFIKAAN